MSGELDCLAPVAVTEEDDGLVVLLGELTEKGLDLIPLIFEMVLWSAKYDSRSEARRITRLVELIRKDNRKISRKVREQVKRGEPIVVDYLE